MTKFHLFALLMAILSLAAFQKNKLLEKEAERLSGQPQTVDISGATQKVKIFLIALGDNGASGQLVGCNDSAVAVEREIPPTKAVLKASLEEILSLKDRTYVSEDKLGLYNALAQAKFQVDTVSIDENGRAKIELSGSYKFSGVCEDARFTAQIEETARQFATVKEVEIFLNGRNLDNLYKN